MLGVVVVAVVVVSNRLVCEILLLTADVGSAVFDAVVRLGVDAGRAAVAEVELTQTVVVGKIEAAVLPGAELMLLLSMVFNCAAD